MGLGEVASSRICTDIAVLYDYVQANAANEFREVTRKATRIERQTLECLSPWSI